MPNQESDDLSLIQQTLSGNQDAFGQLVNRYSSALSAFAYDRLGNVHEAQDAVQETFVTAFQRLGELRDHSRFAGWLYEILRNLCAMRIRRKGVENRSQQHLAQMRAGIAPLNAIEKLESEERKTALRKAVEELSPPLREAVILRFIGGVGRKQAAHMLEISLPALDKRMFRAMNKLRDKMNGVE